MPKQLSRTSHMDMMQAAANLVAAYLDAEREMRERTGFAEMKIAIPGRKGLETYAIRIERKEST